MILSRGIQGTAEARFWTPPTRLGTIEPWKESHKNHLAHERKVREWQAKERGIVASIRSKLTDEEIEYITNRGGFDILEI
jgi:hypothetical protein